MLRVTVAKAAKLSTVPSAEAEPNVGAGHLSRRVNYAFRAPELSAKPVDSSLG